MAVKSPARTEFLNDVLVAALEGGIDYWADISSYQFPSEEHWQTKSVSALVRESEGDDGAPGRWRNVTISTAAEGINLIMKRADIQVAPGVRKAIAGASVTNDAGDVDADLADVIIQVALLGEVRYG